MKLGKLPEKDPIERKPVGLRQSTWKRLEEYQRLYAKNYGKEIKLGDLTEQMLESFMAGDKDFQKHLKESAGSAGAASAA
ncbi:MAG: DUF2274 domain-containing protein [Steroidobacteraceae bacterium]